MAEEQTNPISAAEPPKVNPLAAAGVKPAIHAPAAGVTQTGLKPGLRLPPKPGLATGLKLPPKPVIRKPGSGTATATALPKPVAVDSHGIGKLPTVSATAVQRGSETAPDANAAPKPMETLKTVTQKLKGITQQIPQQAVLHKTGIIADPGVTENKQAAKSKTVRIALSDAIGVAPVKESDAPMKTIRIKRPEGIPTASAAAPAAAPAATASAPTVTQRKTLKITRPGATVRPTGGKFTTAAKKPAASEAAPAEGGEVADIPDIPAMPAVPVSMPVEEKTTFGTVFTVLVSLAACVAIGALAWFLYQDCTLDFFCGGCALGR